MRHMDVSSSDAPMPFAPSEPVAMLDFRMIGTIARYLRKGLRRLRIVQNGQALFGTRYEPSKHYMRGPGPKSRKAARAEDQRANGVT